MPVDDRWSKLSMRDRADLIKIYTKHGVTDLNEIRRHYNSFNDDSTSYNNTKANGGHLFAYGTDGDTPFEQMLRERERQKSIQQTAALLNGTDTRNRTIAQKQQELFPNGVPQISNAVVYDTDKRRIQEAREHNNDTNGKTWTADVNSEEYQAMKSIPSKVAYDITHPANILDRESTALMNFNPGVLSINSAIGARDAYNWDEYHGQGLPEASQDTYRINRASVTAPYLKQQVPAELINYMYSTLHPEEVAQSEVDNAHANGGHLFQIGGYKGSDDGSTLLLDNSRSFRNGMSRFLKKVRDEVKSETSQENWDLSTIKDSYEQIKPYAEKVGNFIPVVGTYQDVEAAIEDPTKENIGWAVASGVTDLASLVLPEIKLIKLAKAGKVAKGIKKGSAVVDVGTNTTQAVRQWDDKSDEDNKKSKSKKPQQYDMGQQNYVEYANGGQLGHITPYGQWQYPHEVTTIPSNNITMQGVNYPVVGVSDTGDKKLMLPGLDYIYDGNYVTEYPVNKYQNGGQINALKQAATNLQTNSMTNQEFADSLYTKPQQAINFYTTNRFPTALNRAITNKSVKPLLTSGAPVFYNQVWDKDGNRDKIVGFWDYLHSAKTKEVSKPLTDIQMAALFGNIYQESQFENIKQKNGPANSMLQMEPARQQQYNTWIKQNGYADGDKTKLLYISYLLQNPEKSDLITPYDTFQKLTTEQQKSDEYKTARNLAQMKEYKNYTTKQAIQDLNSNNIDKTTKAILALFFKAGKPDQARRLKYSRGMVKMFNDRKKNEKR